MAVDVVIYFFVHLWRMLTGLLRSVMVDYARGSHGSDGRKDRDLALTYLC